MSRLLFVVVALVGLAGQVKAQCPDGCCPCPQGQRSGPAWSQAPAWSPQLSGYQSPPTWSPTAWSPPVVYYVSPYPVVHEFAVPAVAEFRSFECAPAYSAGRDLRSFAPPAYGGFDRANVNVNVGGFRAGHVPRFHQVTRTRSR